MNPVCVRHILAHVHQIVGENDPMPVKERAVTRLFDPESQSNIEHQ